jgi:seryl-tRNA synthetase
MSELKSKHWRDKIRMLEEEKRRIETQSEVLQKEKDKQSDQWRDKMARMESEHKKVISNLSDMNDQYSTQLAENEKLRS